jgi:cob(I)alamin adenosyltransferase
LLISFCSLVDMKQGSDHSSPPGSDNSSPPGSSKIYTRTGDQGKTSLIGGTRVSKAHLRLETYGTIDELNSDIGLVIATLAEPEPRRNLLPFLERVQSDLFDLGSHLACEDKALREKLPAIHEQHVTELELKMDELSASLPELKNFILPGGCLAASHAHVARTVCRRAERFCVALSESQTDGSDVEPLIIRYLNRLSDFLFVLARWLNWNSQTPEVLWAPRKGKTK